MLNTVFVNETSNFEKPYRSSGVLLKNKLPRTPFFELNIVQNFKMYFVVLKNVYVVPVFVEAHSLFDASALRSDKTKHGFDI